MSRRSSIANASMLAAVGAARTLAELRDWEPAFALVQGVLDAHRGDGGFSARDMRRLQAWAARWERVPPKLRAFYAANAGDSRAHGALWYMVAGRARPEGGRLGILHQLWRDRLGHDPAHPILVDTRQ